MTVSLSSCVRVSVPKEFFQTLRVSMVFKEFLKNVSRMFQGRLKGVSRLFQRSSKGVSRKFYRWKFQRQIHGFSRVSMIFQDSFKEVSNLLQVSFKGVSGKFQGCFKSAQGIAQSFRCMALITASLTEGGLV